MYKEYGEQAAFYVVYIEEAHADDSWQMPANVTLPQLDLYSILVIEP